VPDLIAKLAVGLIVGTLIGMTGLGGGVLLLPVLIFGFGVPPIVAVGSDMLCNFVTKIGAGVLQWRTGAVHWRMVGALATGSIPGVLVGVTSLAHLRNLYGSGINDILKVQRASCSLLSRSFCLRRDNCSAKSELKPHLITTCHADWL
jgi:uncharacterized protein